jgi:endonuclease/exonuclease/phosphatase family metal-dependent hydrolase
VVRSANWALFRLAGTGLPLLHLNTHLDHKSAAARRNGSALIIRKVEKLLQHHGPETPAVVTGDFNCRPGTPTYGNFANAGFVDTSWPPATRTTAGPTPSTPSRDRCTATPTRGAARGASTGSS